MTGLITPAGGGVQDMETYVTVMLVPAVEGAMNYTTSLLREDKDDGRMDVTMREVGGSNGIMMDVDGYGNDEREPMEMEIERYDGAKNGMVENLSRGGKSKLEKVQSNTSSLILQ